MATKDKKGEKGDGTLEVTVFVPKGQVREGDIKKAALLAARDQIPVAAFNVVLTIDPDKISDEKSADGKKGRDYTVRIDFTPRRTTDPADAHEEVTVDKVMTSLEPLTPEKLAEVTGTAQEA